jgi:hypothetical protein
MRRLALALLALSVACGSDAPPSAPIAPTVTGNWALDNIGGAHLPYLLEQRGLDKLELMEAAVTASANGQFSATSTERTTISGQQESQSYIDPGHFTATGAIVTFTFDSDGSVVHGTLAGDSLTFSEGTAAVVYRRK